MTVEDEGYEIDVHVVSELVEKIFLNIPADWLKRLVGTDSCITRDRKRQQSSQWKQNF